MLRRPTPSVSICLFLGCTRVMIAKMLIRTCPICFLQRQPMCYGSPQPIHSQDVGSSYPQGIQSTPASFAWPTDPWMPQNQPLSSCAARDPFYTSAHQPPMNHSNDFRYCQWSSSRSHTDPLRSDHGVQPHMLWNAAY